MIGELLPDRPARDNPGVLQAVNVVPYAGAYRPVRQFEAATDALASPCRGASVLLDAVGTVYNYAGDGTDVYALAGSTWNSLASGYNAGRWEFSRFYDTAIAVNGNDPLQTGVLGNPLSDVATAPVGAKTLTVARNFTIVGNYGAGGTFQADAAGVAWSALGQPATWGGGESGSQHLDGVGEVVKLIPGEYVTVLCQRGIYRMNYVGGVASWALDHVENARGTYYQGLVAWVGHRVFYLADNGFYVFDGASSMPISSGKLTQTFYADFDRNAGHLCSAIADTENNVILFAYPGRGHKGVANRQMAYNYQEQAWSGPIEREVQTLVYSLTPGTFSDSIDELCDNPPWDATLCDAASLLGGTDPFVAAFIPGNVHAKASGPALVALLESGEYSFNPDRYAFVSGFRPVIDGATAGIEAAVDHRNTTGGPVSRAPLKAVNPRTGIVDQRVNARYHRFRLRVSGGFTAISGGEPILLAGGR